MERVWDTLQKCLPPLLRMNGITTVEAANRWLAEVYRQDHNARFAVAAAEEGSAFIPFVGELDNILCVEQERVAGLDNTVRYDGRVLQIPQSRHRHHFAKSTIRVLEYWDGAIACSTAARDRALPSGRNPQRRRSKSMQISRVSPFRDRTCGRRGQLRGQTAPNLTAPPTAAEKEALKKDIRKLPKPDIFRSYRQRPVVVMSPI